MRRCLQCLQSYEDVVQFCPRDGTALPPPDSVIGKLIDEKYRVDAVQGVGGMGAVYRATQLNLDRTVALKIVKGEFLADSQITERFKREALAVGRLNHPNIVTVYDFGLMDDLGAYLVMEFLQGRTLRQELKERGRIEAEEAAELMAQMCSAVYAAHLEGLIHRDLKPDNIFLQATPEGGRQVKVLDFGVAKFTGVPDPLGAELTVTGMIIGTPVYMSPEQCKGEDLDARSDIYALGCVFYEMLTGRPPFTATNNSGLVVKHASEAPKPPSSQVPGIPLMLESAILRALAKDPDDRFQTAAELGEAIEGAMAAPADAAPVVSPTSEIALSAALSHPAEDGTPAKNGPSSLVDQLFSTGATGGGKRRLAVLPFVNVARDEEVGFLDFAVADALITELSGEGALSVRPSTAVAQYREKTPDPSEVRDALDVEMLVTGSFIKHAETLQATAQLVDIQKNEVIWQHRLTVEYTNAIAAQEQIATEVARGVRGRLGLETGAGGSFETPVGLATGGGGTGAPAPAHDPVAVELYEQAGQLGDSADEREKAIALLDRSVALDPDNAVAWSALAARHYDAGTQVYTGLEHLDSARRAAERALALDRGTLGSVVALGRLLVEAGQAEEIARRATAVVAEQPDSFGARFALGYAFRIGGLADRALREFRAAEAVDGPAVAEQIAAIYFQKQLFEDAIRVLEADAASARRVPSLFLKTVARVQLGDAPGARESTGEMVRIDPNSVYTLMCQVLVRHGEGLGVEPLLEWLRDIQTAHCEVHAWLAQIHAHAGDLPTAMSRLERAVKGGYFNAPQLESSNFLEPLRGSDKAKPVLAAARKRHDAFAREFGG